MRSRSQCPPSQDTSAHKTWDSYLKEYRINVLDTIILKTSSEVKVTMTRKWYMTLRHPKMHSHTKIWNSFLKEYWRYAPDSMPIPETRSKVNVMVSLTQGWYATLWHSKMHAHTEFGIPISNNTRDMPRTRIF